MKFDTHIVAETGTRKDMQDRHHLYFDEEGGYLIGGVYDGHGGVKVADNAVKLIPREFIRLRGKGVNVKEAFKKAYKIASHVGQHRAIGSTALTFLISDKELAVANTGDSRMILVNGEKKYQLTTDHRVTDADEMKRLKSCGAKIKNCYVVMGARGINISRSLGNLDMKKIGVTEEPEVKIYKMPDKYILIAASDGLWGYMPNEGVRRLCNGEETAENIGDKLLKVLIQKSRKYEYLDNTTIMVIKKI